MLPPKSSVAREVRYWKCTLSELCNDAILPGPGLRVHSTDTPFSPTSKPGSSWPKCHCTRHPLKAPTIGTAPRLPKPGKRRATGNKQQATRNFLRQSRDLGSQCQEGKNGDVTTRHAQSVGQRNLGPLPHQSKGSVFQQHALGVCHPRGERVGALELYVGSLPLRWKNNFRYLVASFSDKRRNECTLPWYQKQGLIQG